MKRLVLALAMATGLLASVERAPTQFLPNPNPNPLGRPAISPYLNLNRSGNPAINYYGLVKPQFDTSQQLQLLQRQQQLQQQELQMYQFGVPTEDAAFTGYSQTGHSTTYFNYSHYFGQASSATRPAVGPINYGKR
jgi:hypothetical protein